MHVKYIFHACLIRFDRENEQEILELISISNFKHTEKKSTISWGVVPAPITGHIL
jgi:hypothetical protein